MRITSLATLRRPWLGVAAAALTLQACRSESTSNTRSAASTPGAVQSAPLVLPVDDSTLAYRLPSTQRSTDAAHRAVDAGLSMLPPIALREDSRLAVDVLSVRDLTG